MFILSKAFSDKPLKTKKRKNKSKYIADYRKIEVRFTNRMAEKNKSIVPSEVFIG